MFQYRGLIIGLILLATSFIKQQGIKLCGLDGEISACPLTLACAAGQFVIALGCHLSARKWAANRLTKFRSNTLCEFSLIIFINISVCFGGAMIAALLVFFIISRKNFTLRSKKVSKDCDFKADFKINFLCK